MSMEVDEKSLNGFQAMLWWVAGTMGHSTYLLWAAIQMMPLPFLCSILNSHLPTWKIMMHEEWFHDLSWLWSTRAWTKQSMDICTIPTHPRQCQITSYLGFLITWLLHCLFYAPQCFLEKSNVTFFSDWMMMQFFTKPLDKKCQYTSTKGHSEQNLR